MTLRDAIREMVRWCQMNHPDWCCSWRCRDAFRMDIERAAQEVWERGGIAVDSSRLIRASLFVRTALSHSGELDFAEQWLSATRSVWATL